MTDTPNTTIDRSGARWVLDRPPELTYVESQRDTTAEFGLNRSNIWTQGGQRVRLTIELAALVEIGAAPPDLDEIAQRILAALAEHRP